MQLGWSPGRGKRGLQVPGRLVGQHSPSPTARLPQGSHTLQGPGQRQHTATSVWNPTGGCVRALSPGTKSQCFRAGEWRDKYSVASNLITHTSSRRKKKKKQGSINAEH